MCLYNGSRIPPPNELGGFLREGIVNTEVKYLALRYAFEEEGVHRLQLGTDLRNERSQRAIERIGAVREGALRDNLRRPDGTYRTSVVYGILSGEWPKVRARLEEMLRRSWSDPLPTDHAPGPAAQR